MQLLEHIKRAWLEAGRTFVGDGRDFVFMNVTPGVRGGVMGMHCILYANEDTMWPDIAMSGQYVYQLPVLRAVQKIVQATEPLMRSVPNAYAFMPNELVALASTDRMTLEAAGVRLHGPCTVPATNYSTVSKGADDAWIKRMNEQQLRQLFDAFDPWARVLASFPFFNGDGVQTATTYRPPATHWLNLMVVPARPMAEMDEHDLLAVVNCSQPGWNFVAGDNPHEFFPSLREILGIVEEYRR